jgi:large subunit ribosomal protein L18
MKTALKTIQHYRRKKRSRAKVSGTAKRPRLSVYRSLKQIKAQLIDDEQGVTLASINSASLNQKDVEQAGQDLAKLAQEKQIKACVFDRGGLPFHGRIKAFATGARAGGLEF